jgi:hypothetical protein
MKRIAVLMLFALAFFAMHGAVYAGTLRITDGTTTQTIIDGSGFDSNPNFDVITYVASVGSWYLNVTTALTNAGLPTMDVNSIDYAKFGSSSWTTLTIMYTEDSSIMTGSGGVADIGGTANGGTIKYKVYAGVNAFDLTTQLASLGAFSGGAFSGTTPISPGFTIPNSGYITQVITITPTNKTPQVSFNAELKKVPEPSLVMLLGIGVLGISAGWRKFVK